MSVVVPKRRIRNTHTVDPEGFNENLLPFVEATEARLNEHNWKEDAFTATTADRDLFSGNIGFTVRKAVEDVDHTAINNATKATAIANAAAAGAFEIPKTGSWATVEDAELDFVTTGSMALIFAQALYWTSCDETAPEASVLLASDDPGIMIALRVDGAIIPESIMGSAELGNELLDDHNSPGIATDSQRPHPVATRTLEPLTPGRHTVELVARLCGPQTDPLESHFILRRELNILEIGAG